MTYKRRRMIIDITVACDLSFLLCFFLTKTMEISKCNFWTTMVQGWSFFHYFFLSIFMGPTCMDRRLVIIDIIMAHDLSF